MSAGAETTLRTLFGSYYPPTEDQFSVLWRDGLFVLDTNALLDLHRYSPQARDDLLGALRKIRNRIWIPYQVALEYHRNFKSAVASCIKAYDDLLPAFRSAHAAALALLSPAELKKRSIYADVKQYVEAAEQSAQQFCATLEAARRESFDAMQVGLVQQAIQDLVGSSIGPRPASQQELDAIYSDGGNRYGRRQPPGFADDGKSRQDNPIYVDNGLRYEAKFGDLIMWRQLLTRVAEEPGRPIALISAEKKEDWWWRTAGQTHGPQPELVREAREAGASCFWIYSPDRFLKYAAEYLSASVAETSLEDVKEISSPSPVNTSTFEVHDFVRAAVSSWLLSAGYSSITETTTGQPTFLSKQAGLDEGIWVMDTSATAFRPIDRAKHVASAIATSQQLGLAGTTIVFVCASDEHARQVATEDARLLNRVGAYGVWGTLRTNGFSRTLDSRTQAIQFPPD